MADWRATSDWTARMRETPNLARNTVFVEEAAPKPQTQQPYRGGRPGAPPSGIRDGDWRYPEWRNLNLGRRDPTSRGSRARGSFGTTRSRDIGGRGRATGARSATVIVEGAAAAAGTEAASSNAEDTKASLRRKTTGAAATARTTTGAGARYVLALVYVA